MTQEEKAKRYDEAVINGSRLWECGEITRENYEYIFPELKDEDERIRKALIKFHKSIIDIDGVKGSDIIAWLERQAQKPAAWSEEEEKNFKKAIKVLKVTNFHHTADMLQEMKYKLISSEKTNWKPSDEQLDALQYVYRNCNPLPSDKEGWDNIKTLELMYHDLKKLKG